MMLIIFGVILVLAGGFAFIQSRNQQTLIDLIINTPTTRCSDVTGFGLHEIKGVIEADNPLECPGTGEPCVYYRIKVEQEVIEGGGFGSRRRSAYWETIRDDTSEVPFRVRDASGTFMVFASGAEVDAPQTMYDKSNAGILEKILSRRGDVTGQRVEVHSLAMGTEVYVLGEVQPSSEGNAIRSGTLPFVISHKSEDKLISSRSAYGYAWLAGSAIGVIGGFLLIILGATGRSLDF